MLGFINKDVLSEKIVSAAKQHTAQDPKLLSYSFTLEGNTAEGTGMSPRGLFHLSLSAVKYVKRFWGGGSRPFQPSDNRGWCVCQLSSAPMCRQRGVFVGWGRDGEDESRKTRRLKSTITLFLSLTTSNVKTILTRPVKTTRWGSITARGHFVFLITFVSLSSFPWFPSIPNMDLSLFTKMCFPEVLCPLWRMTEPECTISESKINSGKECWASGICIKVRKGKEWDFF